MPEPWELTSAHYEIIEDGEFHDPESEEYDKAIEYAARRVLLEYMQGIRTREAGLIVGGPGYICIDSDPYEQLLRAHGLDEEVKDA